MSSPTLEVFSRLDDFAKELKEMPALMGKLFRSDLF